MLNSSSLSQRFGIVPALALCASLSLSCPQAAFAADEPAFRVGFGESDITPPPGLPMWGYGARHDKLSEGALDPLMAKAIVIEAGEGKLAIVGLDLGRGPTVAMMKEIRAQLAPLGIAHVLACGSHTHHGPVIELVDEPNMGQGKFDAAVKYSRELPGKIVAAIREAHEKRVPARLGVATRAVPFNRNRQSKREPKATDPTLAVVRFDDEAGKPIAVLVNFAAHPVLTDTKILKYSADYVGFLTREIETKLGTHAVFIQGAAGDMSCNPPDGKRDPKAFGEALAEHAISLAQAIHAEAPKHPALAGEKRTFKFSSRVALANPVVSLTYERAFFPELVKNFVREFGEGVGAELDTILLNGEVAIVGASGEFFSNHANRLRERAYLPHTLFFGYCNGHSMYFPTIEAASEGGYGADPGVSPVELGAGEIMMNEALLTLYRMQGKFPAKAP